MALIPENITEFILPADKDMCAWMLSKIPEKKPIVEFPGGKQDHAVAICISKVGKGHSLLHGVKPFLVGLTVRDGIASRIDYRQLPDWNLAEWIGVPEHRRQQRQNR